MGKVKIQTYNQNLMQFADYSNVDIIKKLFMNYAGLKKLGEKGDSVAISIYMDMDYCLEQLEQEEREIIEAVLIDGYTYREYAEEHEVNIARINRILNRALDKCKWLLERGRMIE